jgi:hypothetical protein
MFSVFTLLKRIADVYRAYYTVSIILFARQGPEFITAIALFALSVHDVKFILKCSKRTFTIQRPNL